MAFNIDRNEASLLGDRLCASLSVPVHDHPSDPALTYGCGGVYFSSQKVTVTALLAQCDRILLQAMAGGVGISLLEDVKESDNGKGAQYWKHLIEDAIEQGRVFLLAQPVKYFADERHGLYEVVGRLKNQEDEFVPAGQFIPMADRYQLTPLFDLSVLKRLTGRMLAHGGEDIFAINLSIHSIHDAQLLSWLSVVMRNYPAVARRMVFEFTEFGLVQDRAGVDKFIADIRALGGEFAVDNFGLHHTAFEYLQSLKPKYVKLSPAYVRGLQDNLENQFFISSVVNITRSLDIRTFVLGVEDASVLPMLRELGVDGYQGYVNGGMIEAVSLDFGEITSHLVIDK
jgi:EAL domain-containing protein (putative c-di-GMP-specific phosphodiesterase class I)